MKLVFFISFLITYVTGGFAQVLPLNPAKPAIDTGSLDKWLSVKTTLHDAKVAITNDGNYVCYKIRESWRLPATFIIQAIKENWKMELHNVANVVFTKDSRKAVFIEPGENLSLHTLGSSSKENIPHVGSFKIFKQGRAEWLAYQLNTPGKDLVLRNLETGKEQFFPRVIEYLLSQDGNILVLRTESEKDSAVMQSLHWISLPGDKPKAIWDGRDASNLVLDGGGMQLAFRVEEKRNEQPEISIWYYKAGTNRAVQLADNQSAGINKGIVLDHILKFSIDGSKLFIRLKEKPMPMAKPDAVKVDVWSYTDAQLQEAQLQEARWTRTYLTSVSIKDHQIIRLQQEDEEVIFGVEETGGSWILVNYRKGEHTEWNWNRAAQPSFFLVNTSTGARQEVTMSDPLMQLGGEYIIGIGADRTNIYSYEIGTGITRNITGSLPIPAGDIENDEPYKVKWRGLLSEGTTLNKEALIVHDGYDLWQIDPAGKKAPVNLTNGYGRKKNIEFHLAGMYSGKTFLSGKTMPDNGAVILSAFKKTSKSGGFYRMILGKKGDPQLISMDRYYYDPGYLGACQVKARDAEVYVVMRESTTQSPNYFWTKDFKSYIRISSVYPEKNYNWLTAELVSFTTLDGRSEQAVLYKPENFDPNKKYPVIIHYYDRKSQDLNRYHPPAEQNGELDIAWFASQEYIVLTPDIHFKIGETGNSAVNSVVAAARFISRFAWIDAKHIGIQGHSFGGYLTNYIVTQTNLFAAAVSSSGMSDIISNYLGFLGDHSNHDWYENRICRIGTTLWERPELYIKNSPVFQADKVTTPILTIANKKDANVRFEQGVEWFISLRRLGKKVWMLQYDEGGHGLWGQEYKDYIIRTTQFFDHYLKGAPAPRWMTRGIPARMKGIDDGLELDNEIKTPGPGLLTDRSNPNTNAELFKNRKEGQ